MCTQWWCHVTPYQRFLPPTSSWLHTMTPPWLDDPSHLIYLQDHPLGLFFSGSSNHNELHLHTVMPCNPLSTVLTPPLLASPPWPRPDDPSHLIYPIVQGHPRGLIFSGPSKYSELHLHTVMPCNPLSTVLTPPLLASPLMTPAAAFTSVSVRTNHFSGRPRLVKTAQGRVKLTHQLSDRTSKKKTIIDQLFMRLQQQIHTLLERWIPSRKQPFCLCWSQWCTCSVVHDGNDLSIFVWSPALNAINQCNWIE